MRFEKGRSGNPGGRPKAHGEIRDFACQHTDLALRTLVEIAERGENESARVTAANALLDRGLGKPAVPVADDVPLQITFKIGNRDLRPPVDVTPASDAPPPMARLTVERLDLGEGPPRRCELDSIKCFDVGAASQQGGIFEHASHRLQRKVSWLAVLAANDPRTRDHDGHCDLRAPGQHLPEFCI